MHVNGLDFAPLTDVSWFGGSDHVVQFYETNDYLLESVRSFIAVGLVTGEVCIVLATADHRADLADRLSDSGLNMAALVARGQYMALDASDLLGRFMRDGALDGELCTSVIGQIIETATARGQHVRVFGELVAVLCAAGKYDFAVQLEGLWNELQKRYGFALFCGYPMSAFGTHALAESHRHVCAQHSAVIPAESYHAVADAGERMRVIAELQQRAASLEAEIEERKAAETALARSLRLRDEFLASVSHDLKTPLTVLQGYAQLLRRRALRAALDPAAVLRASEQVEARARSITALVDELLDITRLRAGEDIPLHRSNADLVPLLKELAARYDAGGERNRVVVISSVPSLRGWWDEQRLRRAFENLIINAIKYSPGDREITIRLSRVPDGSEAVVSVEDHGIGVPAHDLPHVFEPFYRGENVDRRTAGTGIGLAAARQTVERHGGTITMESAEGVGSTVIVRVPLSRG